MTDRKNQNITRENNNTSSDNLKTLGLSLVVAFEKKNDSSTKKSQGEHYVQEAAAAIIDLEETCFPKSDDESVYIYS